MQAITLTAAEQAILAEIELDALALRDHIHAQQNAEAVCELMGLLLKRSAIPDVRVRYFTDPDYNLGGRGKSRKQGFERNGTAGKEIFEHPHFLKYLRYFLFGAQLPQIAIDKFCEQVSNCGRVSSSDVAPLGKFAREQARVHRLEAASAADEFFKLALDCGLSRNYASGVRDAVKQLRRR